MSAMSSIPADSMTTADDRLRFAARTGSAEAAAAALREGARDIDDALRVALVAGHAAVLQQILERSYLAKTIGSIAGLLHRPNLSPQERTRATRLLLQYYACSDSVDAYRAGVCAVLCAGAVLREGPLLLGALVADGHLEAALPAASSGELETVSKRSVRNARGWARAKSLPPRSRAAALQAAKSLNDQAERIRCYIYLSIYVSIRIYIYRCMYICKYICICIFIYICTYT